MQKIILASNNLGKIKELNAMLSGFYTVVSLQQMNVSEVPESGQTFIENALIKAKNAAKQAKLPAIADDSGIVVDALNGAPGIYSARYAGVHGDDEANTQKLLAAMKAIPDGKRGAHFCCAMAFVKSADDRTPITAERTLEGEILHQKIGNNGFGYDPIFYLPAYQCSAAQLDAAEKNKISHRAKALQALLALLKK